MNNDYQNTQTDMELENMRQQMNTLKKKLEQQEIVNDQMIRRSMKKNADTITRRYYMLMVIGLLMVPYGYWAFVKLSNFSVAFWIGTSILMLICTGATYYNMQHNLSDSNMMRNNLVEVRRKMARAKKFDADWLFFGIPAILLWFAWFVYEVNQSMGDCTNALFWGGCVGGIIGAIIGFKIHFRTQRQYQEIIDQIEDITTGE